VTPSDPLFYRQLIVWVWTAWALYWLAAAIGTKKTRRRESPRSRLVHVLPLLVGGVLIGVPGLPWDVALGMRLWPPSELLYGAGFASLVAGLGFSVWARVHLGRNWSGVVTVKEGHELIRTGPYGYVRHPIYTGILAGALGTAVCSGTLGAILGVVIIAIALERKMRIEEALMRETFPGQYQKYCEDVPALVPFTGSRRSAPR
jgi:protein-S-isoprenylcysteine O-methyltransferase Ste14